MRTFIHTTGWSLLTVAVIASFIWLRTPAPVISMAPALLLQPHHVVPKAAPPASMQPATPATAPTLAELVDHFSATGNPHDAMAAYLLLKNCAAFNRDGDQLIFEALDRHRPGHLMPGFRNLTDVEKAQQTRRCTGMTERMRVARLDYLAIAARAGVMGAAIEMASEGPFGDRTALDTRPDDPLVQAWKLEVVTLLARAADGADLEVLEYMAARQQSNDPLFNQYPALAYRYGVARGLIYGDLIGPEETVHLLYAPDGALMQGIAAGLSPEQRAAELAAATRIADLARARHQAAQKH